MRSGLAALSFLLVVSCSCDEPAVPVEPPPPPTMAIDAFTLSQGLDVELISGPCGESAALALLLEVGADHDPSERSGLTRVLSRIVASQSRGVELTVGSDHTLYTVVVERGAIDAELDRVATLLTAPAITQEALDAARAEVLAELERMRGGDPALTAESFAVESIQPTRGGGWRGGVASELASLDVAQLQAFASAHLRAGNARLVIAGAVDPVAMRARVERTLGTLAAGEPATPRPPPDATVTGTLVMGASPTSVAIAVAAPLPADPLHPAFLVLATRMLAADEAAWTARYDVVARPETLFVSAPLGANMLPEAAATRLRAEVAEVTGTLLSPSDITAARERFAPWLGTSDLDPAVCAADPRALAMARARRAQLGVDALHLSDALGAVTEDQLREAAGAFGAARSAAVIAGGEIR